MSAPAEVPNDADPHPVVVGAAPDGSDVMPTPTAAPPPEVLAPKEGVAAAVIAGSPGRALIGWMTEEQATLALASRRQDQSDNDTFREQARAARAAVAARPAGVDQEGLVEPPPEALAAHIAQLAQQPLSAPYLAEGWQVMSVDLSRVCSLQQTVRADRAAARVAAIDPDDVSAVASVTLPAGIADEEIPVQFDEERRTWLISGANPNLKLVGHYGGRIQEGAPLSFGFNVAVVPSFLQVARHHGRHVLRDGYHRAFGLLQRGITRVPAFVRDFGVGGLGLGAGLFGTDVYLSTRPPLLPDFLDDAVAADVPIPAVQKMIVIQGMELTPLS
jgi:hypothetical protein